MPNKNKDKKTNKGLSKRFGLLGISLVIIGITVYGGILIYVDQQEKFMKERNTEVEESLSKIDEMIDGSEFVNAFPQYLESESWQEDLKRYKREKNIIQASLLASFFCASSGLVLMVFVGHVNIRNLFSKVIHFGSFLKNRRTKSNLTSAGLLSDNASESSIKSAMRDGRYIASRLKEIGRAADICKSDQERPVKDLETVEFSDGLMSVNSRQKQRRIEKLLAYDSSKKVIKNSSLKAKEISWEPVTEEEEDRSKSGIHDAVGYDISKQVIEIQKEMEKVREAAINHTTPLDKTLSELTEQVTAIREYAVNQQQRVNKLQEGYDWKIIRSFALKIIRCIDNLENKIDRFTQIGEDASGLEEVREELLFALESSAIERFSPEVGSSYKGQEKEAAIIKEKEICEDPEKRGKIARVMRCGYRYVVDEKNGKVVRSAQVKLYG